MRTWGRPPGLQDANGNPAWVEVQTDANGFNDYVFITTLAQTLKLNLGESPFYADRGIPAHQSVVQQVHPDYYVAVTQSLFAQYFAALIIAKIPSVTPTYRLAITTHAGAKFNVVVAI